MRDVRVVAPSVGRKFDSYDGITPSSTPLLEPTQKWVVRPFVVPPLGGFSRCFLFQNREKAGLQINSCVGSLLQNRPRKKKPCICPEMGSQPSEFAVGIYFGLAESGISLVAFLRFGRYGKLCLDRRRGVVAQLVEQRTFNP